LGNCRRILCRDLPGYNEYASPVCQRLIPYIWAFCCDLTVSFYGITHYLDFKSVIDVLGSDWKEDKEAEEERFEAVTREAFNPPFPQPTGYMGNVTYTPATPILVPPSNNGYL